MFYGKVFLTVILAIVTVVRVETTVLAADFGDGSPDVLESRWDLRFTPYAWLPWMTGDMTIKGQKLNVDTNIFEILGEADTIIPWMSYMEARNGKFAAYLDTIYANITLSGGAVKQANPIRGVSLTVGAQAGVEYEYAIIEAGAAYEIAHTPIFGAMTAIDVYAGGRYWYQDLAVNLAVTGTVTLPGGFTRTGNLVRSGGVSADWIDPLVGLRLRQAMGPGQEIIFKGDIGGFGAGSDFSYNLAGVYTWEFSDRWGIVWAGAAGYRALYADYSEGSGTNKFSYDLLQHGPIIGLSMRF